MPTAVRAPLIVKRDRVLGVRQSSKGEGVSASEAAVVLEQTRLRSKQDFLRREHRRQHAHETERIVSVESATIDNKFNHSITV